MLKALMIDVDGVLIQGRPHDGRPWSSSLHLDLGVSTDDLHRRFFDLYWEDIVVGRSLLMDSLPQALAEIAPNLTAHQLVNYWFEQDSSLNLPLLEELATFRSKGIPVYLATNQEHLRARHIMDVLGLSSHVDGIFYSAELGVRKPHREFFDKVAAKLALDPGELLLVDDTAANIRAAAAAGWKAVHWPVEDLSAQVLGH